MTVLPGTVDPELELDRNNGEMSGLTENIGDGEEAKCLEIDVEGNFWESIG